MASFAEITAVAIYERMVSVAASEAVDLLVVFKSALYAPPFKGKAPTTSPYIFLNRKRTAPTISSDNHAYCPEYIIASADTYKQDELISFPEMAVAASSFSFFLLLSIFRFIKCHCFCDFVG